MRAELVRPRNPKRVLAAVEVEARDLLERRPGRRRPARAGPANIVTGVPELGELAGQMAAVDALAAAVGIAPVDEECDAKGVAGARQGDRGIGHVETRMEGGPRRKQAAAQDPGGSRALARLGAGLARLPFAAVTRPLDHRGRRRPHPARGRRSALVAVGRPAGLGRQLRRPAPTSWWPRPTARRRRPS